MKSTNRQASRSTLELIEEAVHLVREAPAGALAFYYVGALPFVLGFLFFWADMSRSPFAERHLAESTLGMAILFIWMKFCQSLFTRAVRAHFTGVSVPLTLGGSVRLFLAQAAIQPSGLFLIPLAAIPMLPLGWVYAFYQNVTVLADAEAPGLRPLVKKSVRQASFWPGQNHMLLLILSGFGLFVFANWATACFAFPSLVKMLLGIESMFTRSVLSMLNTTFLLAMCGLTYLCVDPILKAAFTLRCFYGESLESGQDLRVELRQVAAGTAGLALLVLAMLFMSAPCLAQEPEAGSEAPAVQPARGAAPTASSFSAAQLDQAIGDVSQERKYAWRMPRDTTVEPEPASRGLLGRFLDRVWDLASRALKAVGRALGSCLKVIAKAMDWLLRKLFGNRTTTVPGSSGYGWIFLLELLLYGLVLAVVAGLVFLIYRIWKQRRRPLPAVASEPVKPAPDLADENVGAEDLPEDGWTRLGRELLARGELRLALRAFYLASLAHLAARNLVTLARFKSNRDYERELRRRGHAFPELLTTFDENLAAFEPVWYGMHGVDADTVNGFAARVERIRGEGMPA